MNVDLATQDIVQFTPMSQLLEPHQVGGGAQEQRQRAGLTRILVLYSVSAVTWWQQGYSAGLAVPIMS